MLTEIKKYLIRYHLAILMLCFGISAHANKNYKSYQQALQLFEQADELQAADPDSAKANYQKVANRLEYLIQKSNIKNGWLHYNLGNTYFRMDELGLAIYNYRMAQKYLPYHKDVSHNLQYAQSLVTDATEENTSSRYALTMEYIRNIATPIKMLLFIPLYIIVLLLFITPIKKSFPVFYRWIGFAVLLPITILLALSSIESTKGIIIKDSIIAKKGNSLVYEDALMSGLNKGCEFTLLEQRKEWIKIKLIDGKEAWIQEGGAKIIK